MAFRLKCGAPENEFAAERFAKPASGSEGFGERRNQSGAQRDGQDQSSENKPRWVEELETSIGEPASVCRLLRRFRNPTCSFKIRSRLRSKPRCHPAPPAASSSATGSDVYVCRHHQHGDALGNESTFLQLLVAQIQNQDPTQPMDSSTFLTQLAEFTQVEQLIGIRQDVQQLDPTSTSATSATSSTGSTSGS